MNPDQSPTSHREQTLPVEITPEEIGLCAYVIWEREGRPEGHDVDHWLEAEAQLREMRARG
jgi:hypothetical protein